jgi:hypothetical protein
MGSRFLNSELGKELREQSKSGTVIPKLNKQTLKELRARKKNLGLRSCHPRDIVEQVVDICRYENRPLVITRELLDQACKNYFLEEQAGKQNARRAVAAVKSSGAPRPAGERRPAGQKEEWLS